MSGPVRATARVQITIEFPLVETWAAGTPIEQINAEATALTLDMIARGIELDEVGATIIGKPIVRCVIAEVGS